LGLSLFLILAFNFRFLLSGLALCLPVNSLLVIYPGQVG
jgi:hypothetical protein